MYICGQEGQAKRFGLGSQGDRERKGFDLLKFVTKSVTQSRKYFNNINIRKHVR